MAKKKIKKAKLGLGFKIVFLLEALLFVLILPSSGYFVFSKDRPKNQFQGQGLVFAPLPLPKIKEEFTSQLTAKSILVMDEKSGTVLLAKNPQQRLLPASITKIMTALVALDKFPLNQTVTVPRAYPVGRNMELKAGEQLTVENLIYGLLIHSANDAGFVLASQSPDFIEAMNEKAKTIGLKGSHFVNFDGEEDLNHYSTAYDLAQIARLALKSEIFRKAILVRTMTITDLSGKILHRLETTNELLGKVPEVMGLKTGWTQRAGECFVGYFELGGHGLITVILASKDRFGETVKLLDWAKRELIWEDYSSTHSGTTAET